MSSLSFLKKLFGKKEDVTVNVEIKQSFEPPTYIYKTAVEKSNEPVPHIEQHWIDRYDNKVCPNCGSVLEETPKSDRKCPECGDKILVRSHFQKKDKKVLLKESEKEIFEQAKKEYFDERWSVRSLSMIGVSEDEFLKMKEELGDRFSSLDVMKSMVDRTSYRDNDYTIERHLEFERRRLLLYKENFDRRGFTESAYSVLLSLIYNDMYSILDKKAVYDIIPSFKDELLRYKKELDLSDKDIISDMREVVENEGNHFDKFIDRDKVIGMVEDVLGNEKTNSLI